jgi:hypothetical protein
MLDGLPSQDVLARVGEEILSTTRLPMAISFIFGEMKANGLLGAAMARISHYFAPFQAFVMSRAEEDKSKFPMDQALLILEREAKFRAAKPSPPGLFVYQFEAISRNRLGYAGGLDAMSGDPCYDEAWSDYIAGLRAKLGDVDFADLIYTRSEFHVIERRRRDPEFQPRNPVLFGEKEGKIARANLGRDPLYLFSALQRQLGYPEVPRPRRADEAESRILLLEQRVAHLENRLKLAESEIHNDFDLSEIIVKPEDTAGVPSGWGVRKSDNIGPTSSDE